MNKDVCAPNLKALSLTVLYLIHGSVSVGQIEIVDHIITDELLTSCSHAGNRYKMYLIEKKTKKIRNMKKKKSGKEKLFKKSLFQQRKEKQIYK